MLFFIIILSILIYFLIEDFELSESYMNWQSQLNNKYNEVILR